MNNKKQVMNVKGKGQLIAAFGCAKDFDGITSVTLRRKEGTTVYEFDSMAVATRGRGFETVALRMKAFNAQVNKSIKRLKSTPASALR